MKNKCKDLFYLYLVSDWIQIRVSDQQSLFFFFRAEGFAISSLGNKLNFEDSMYRSAFHFSQIGRKCRFEVA